jgi:hypothetical protein
MLDYGFMPLLWQFLRANASSQPKVEDDVVELSLTIVKNKRLKMMQFPIK